MRVNSFVIRDVNDNYRREWRNAENVGKSNEVFIALWDKAHPDDPVEQ